MKLSKAIVGVLALVSVSTVAAADSKWKGDFWGTSWTSGTTDQAYTYGNPNGTSAYFLKTQPRHYHFFGGLTAWDQRSTYCYNCYSTATAVVSNIAIGYTTTRHTGQATSYYLPVRFFTSADGYYSSKSCWK